MRRTHASVEEVLRLLARFEELEELRLSILSRAVPDPGREWTRSRASSTVDKRLLSREAMEEALSEAEELAHRQVGAMFACYRLVFDRAWEGRELEISEALIRAGEANEEAGRLERARALYDIALTVSLPLQDKRVQLLALRRIARVLLAQGNFSESEMYYSRSAELAAHAEDARSELIARTGLGNVLGYQGRWVDAEQVYLDVLRRLEDRGPDTSRLERGQLYNNLGTCTARQGRWSESEGWLDRALEQWKLTDSPVDLAICLHNHGLLRVEQGRDPEAQQLFREALALEVPQALRAIVAVDLASSFARHGLHGEAEVYARQAEQAALTARSPYVLSHLYRGLGNLARTRGDEDGITFFEKSLEISRERSLRFVEAETLVDYALLRSQIGQRDEAEAYLERAEEIFGELSAACQRARVREVRTEMRATLQAMGD